MSLLDEKAALEVAELAEVLGVSEITVRRDLNTLAGQGFLIRTRGGAMSLEASRHPVDFTNKAAVRQKEKEYIARIAVRYIDDGDTVFLDCGSTVFCLAPLLKAKKINVITNSLPLATALLNSQVKINLVGGEVDQERMAVHGTVAVHHISRDKAVKAFIGVDGLSLERGLSSNSEKESEISMAMAKQSKLVYLLCDSSKLEQDRYLAFAPLSSVDYLITDSEAPEDILDRYRKEGLVILN